MLVCGANVYFTKVCIYWEMGQSNLLGMAVVTLGLKLGCRPLDGHHTVVQGDIYGCKDDNSFSLNFWHVDQSFIITDLEEDFTIFLGFWRRFLLGLWRRSNFYFWNVELMLHLTFQNSQRKCCIFLPFGT